MADYLRGTESLTMRIAMSSQDIGWIDIVKNPRKVLIVNPKDAADCGLMSYVAALSGTGHSEWEYMLAYLMATSIREAAAKGTEADISNMFDRTFTASGNRMMTREEILNHCMKIFEVVEDTPECLRVKIRAAKAA